MSGVKRPRRSGVNQALARLSLTPTGPRSSSPLAERLQTPADGPQPTRYPPTWCSPREVRMQIDQMRRREFITLLGGAARRGLGSSPSPSRPLRRSSPGSSD
jgi:hypothetical protein